MIIFTDRGFEQGKWAGNLAEELRKDNKIPDSKPKGRVWRRTWYQWVQYEPHGWDGPAFWLGKPGILSKSDSLYAGYYVERGRATRPEIPPEEIMTKEWHWHGFIHCICDSNLRTNLAELLANMPSNFEKGIWMENDNLEYFLTFNEEPTFLQAKKMADSFDADEWLNVMVGIRIPKSQCLSLQKKILSTINSAMIYADQMREIIEEATK